RHVALRVPAAQLVVTTFLESRLREAGQKSLPGGLDIRRVDVLDKVEVHRPRERARLGGGLLFCVPARRVDDDVRLGGDGVWNLPAVLQAVERGAVDDQERRRDVFNGNRRRVL